MLDFERKNQLIVEGQNLAEIINRARFDCRVPSYEITVRLCEILDILADDIKETV
jgi:hypothetical protein